jgi:hypothetical protein
MNAPNFEWQYMVTVEHRREYLGLRFFKFSIHTDTCIQVVMSPGQERKGRGHVFGVYCISRQTLFSNYLGTGYAIPTTKKEYEKAFDKVVKALK